LSEATEDPSWSVYMLRCAGGELYTGIALDVQRRFEEHASGRGARFTRGRGPLELVLSHEVGERGLALRLEHAIKRLPRARKEKLGPGEVRRLIRELVEEA